MKDIQKEIPKICIPIQKVGIQNLKLPIFVLEKGNTTQHSVADVDVFVDLEGSSKGIHMSRLIECAHDSVYGILCEQTIEKYAHDILIKSEAKRAELTFKFPYFIKKLSPLTKKSGYIHCDVEMTFINHLNKQNESFLSVEVLTTSLCPCSKEISDYGAHNQRSKIHICGKHKEFVEKFWIEDIVKIIEKNSSSHMYSILKRPDEKYVTEKAYENPKFVEDSSREIFQAILNKDKFSEFEIKVINEESIHLHNAAAIMKYPQLN